MNKQCLTRFRQKDVSRWLNTGSRTANGIIGFPKYETMCLIADFFDVDVGYLTGETDEGTFNMAKTCDYIGLDDQAVQAVRDWIDTGGERLRDLRAATLNAMFASPEFATLATKLLTLQEMSASWNTDPSGFGKRMSSLASDSNFSGELAYQLILGALYGMASESFSALLRDAYPAPDEPEFGDGTSER